MQCVITRHLRLDRKNADGLAPVHFRVCWAGQKVRFSPGEKVHPKDWNEQEEIVKKSAGPSARQLNARLNAYTDALEEFFQKHAGLPTQAEVQEVIDKVRSELTGRPQKKKLIAPSAPAHLSLAEYIPEYIRQRKSDRSKSWQSAVNIMGRHLLAFREGIDWPDLTLNTLNQFKLYLQEEEELSDNTLASYVYLLRGMCKYALRDKCPVPPDYDWLEVRLAGDTIRPSLTLQDLKQIREATFEQPEELINWPDFHRDMEVTRWYFLCACGTALRHSDWGQLLHPRIITVKGHPCLLAVQQKTGKQVPIPLSEGTLELLKNPVTDKPPIERVMFTKKLKVMARLAKLDRVVQVSSYNEGVLLITNLPLWQTLATHAGRRTYATIMTQGGLSTRVLQEIMGHKVIASTQKYTSVSNDSIVEQALNAWVAANV